MVPLTSKALRFLLCCVMTARGGKRTHRSLNGERPLCTTLNVSSFCPGMPAEDVHMWDYAWEQVRGENPFMREAPVDCEVVAVSLLAVAFTVRL